MKKLILLALCFTSMSRAQDPIFDPTMAITAYGLVNSPLGEEVDKIIDGDETTKFLDFELGDGMGFTVNLGATARTAFSMDITTANDFPARDPIDFEILGSNDGVGFTSVATGSIVCIPDRFNTRSYMFANSAAYLYYRVNFSEPCDPSGGTGIPSIQVAEVQLFEEVLGLSDAEIFEQQLRIFPNPNNGEFSIVYTGTDTLIAIELIDVNGKRIYKNNSVTDSGEQRFKMSSLKSGMYFLKVTSEKASVIKKLLVF